MKSRSALESVFSEQLKVREAKAELWGALLFTGSAFLLFILLSLMGDARELHSFQVLRKTFLGFVALIALLVVVVKMGWWHPSIRFINTTLQISLLSTFFFLIIRERGTAFALATALPMLYCLAISLTAFRLSPWLTFYAGALAAVEMIFLYAFFMRPHLTEEVIAANPTLSWPAMIGRVLVFLAIGASSAVAALSLRSHIRKQMADQNRIQQLERTFGRLVDPEVARRILEDENWMTPSRRDAVVMFADLKGFTKFSETRDPEEVAEFLNRCWSIAADCVERHGGVINKYLGDGFLAIFGVPLDLPDAEKAAANTATQLQQDLASILEPEGLSLCVGIHSGPMIAGGIGSESRCEFTVIGSTVNLASRLESLNRSLSTTCLTSQPIAEKISPHWELRDHGGHRVKGVREEVSVYELIQPKSEDE